MRVTYYVYIFLLSVTVRLIYQSILIQNSGIYLTPDSSGYIELASNIILYGEMYPVLNDVIPDIYFMPIYPYFISILFKIFGSYVYEPILIVQAIIDSTTVIAITIIAAHINKNLAIIVALLSSLWPNMIVHASYILTDTLFLAFFTWALCCCVLSFRSKHLYVLLIASGLLFGAAIMTRPILIYFPVFLMPSLACMYIFEKKMKFYKSVLIASIPIIIMAICVSPRFYETYKLYNKPALTMQKGIAALHWYYPCIRTTWGCGENHQDIMHEMEELVLEEAKNYSIIERNNPAILDDIRSRLAVEKILELPKPQIIKGLLAGVITGLFHTSFSRIAHQLNLKRGTILDAKYGDNLFEKLENSTQMFSNIKFAIVWAVALCALIISRVVQFVGVVHVCNKSNDHKIAIFLFICAAYFIIINGPIGDAKYRLPIEPMLIIFFTIGMKVMLGKLKVRQYIFRDLFN